MPTSLYDNRTATLTKGSFMIVLTTWDVIALTIALTSSLIVIITTAVANHRLTESRDYWRYQYQELKHFMEQEL
jgi:hypothetical protein